MGYKKFVRVILVFLAVLVASNYLVWELHTKRFFDGYDTAVMGDLARLGYMPEYAVSKQPSPGHHPGLIHYNDYRGQPIDMVTIGDSFSFGVGGGQHAFFQEHIIINSDKRDFTVLNLITPKGPKPEMIWPLLNSGLLEKIKPKYLLVESGERGCIENYGLRPADAGLTDTIGNLDSILVKGGRLAESERKGIAAEGERSFFRFMTFANLKHPLYKVLYRITDRPPGARVFKAALDRPFFSTEHPDTLLYLDADIEKMSLVSEGSVSMLNRNMNELSEALEKKGIKLIFMPIPDKYSLYAPYIQDNDLPQSRFFELLRMQDRKYVLIDTRAMLSKALEDGVMDLYHADDTHWSWKAPDRIFREFRLGQADKEALSP